MTVKESIDQLLQTMPAERLSQVLDFAQFLNFRDEQEGWRQFGQSQLALAYGPTEPDYTTADLKPELNS